MGKRSTFARRAQDAYDTPPEAVSPLLPHLGEYYHYAEPCAGSGALAGALSRTGGWSCMTLCDIAPRSPLVQEKDALTLTAGDVDDCDVIITNPPWTRSLLHPMIERFASLRPTWLLFDADWMHTRQAVPYLTLCHKIVSVGRISWMQNGTSGKDNCAWYFFDANAERAATEFVGRAA